MPLGVREVLLVVRAKDLASRQIREIGAAFGTIGAESEALNAKMGAVGGTMLGVGVGLTAVGAAGLAFVKSSFDTFAEVEQHVAHAQTAVHGGLTPSLKELSDMVLQVGKDVPVAFGQIAPELYDIFSSIPIGTLQEAHTVLDDFAKAAVAGMTDMQTAGRSAFTIMNDFGLKAQDLTRILDVQFKTVALGKGVYTELAPQFGKIAPIASVTGQSLEVMGGALAFASEHLRDASTAGTATYRAFEAIARPQVIQRLHDMGIEVVDAAGNFRPFNEVLGELGQKLHDMPDPQRIAILREILHGVGDTAIARQFFTSLIDDVSGFNDIMKQVGDSAGGLQKAYDIMKDTPEAKIQAMNNAFDTLKFEIGAAVAPVFVEFVGYVKEGLDWFNGLSEGTQQLVGKFILFGSIGAVVLGVLTLIGGALLIWMSILGPLAGGVAAADEAASGLGLSLSAIMDIGPAIVEFFMGFGGIIDSVAVALFNFGGILDFIAALFTTAFSAAEIDAILAAIGEGLATAGVALAGLGISFLALLPIIGLIVVAGVALYDIFKNMTWAEFKQHVMDAMQAVKDAIQEVRQWLSDRWQEIVDRASKAWNDVHKEVEDIINKARATIKDVVNDISAWWDKNGHKMLNEMQKAFGNAWKDILNTIEPVIKAVVRIIDFGVTIIKALWDRFGEDILDVVRIVWGLVAAIIENVVGIIANVIQFVADIINGDWGKAWHALGNIVGDAFSLIISIIQAAIGLLVDIGHMIIKVITAPFIWIYDFLVGNSLIPDLVYAIIGFFQLLGDFFMAVFGPIIQAFAWVWQNALVPAFNAVRDVLDWLWHNIFEPVVNFIKDVFHVEIDGLRAAWDILRAAIDIIWQTFQNIWNIMSNVAGFITGIFLGVLSSLKSAWDDVTGAIGGAVDGLSSFLDLSGQVNKAIANSPPSSPTGSGGGATGGGGGGGGGQSQSGGYALGGIIDRPQWAMLHSPEVVIPLNNINRARELSVQSGLLNMLGAPSISVNISEGAIHVSGVTDPVEVAKQVHAQIEEVIADAIAKGANR